MPIGRKAGVVVNSYILLITYEVLITTIFLLIDKTSYISRGFFTFFTISIINFVVLFLFAEYVDWKDFLRGLRMIGTLLAILGSVETLTRRSLFIGFMDSEARHLIEETVQGTAHFQSFVCFCHPILAALFFVVIFILCLYFPYKNPLVQILAIGTTLVSLYGTQARSSWLTLMSIITLIIIRKLMILVCGNLTVKTKIHTPFSNFIMWAIALGVGGVVLAVLVSKFDMIYSTIVDRFTVVFDTHSRANSRVVRLSNLHNVLEYESTHPIQLLFGQGVGYSLRFSNENPVALNWRYGMDNQFLTYILNCGIIGILFIAGILFRAFLSFFKYDDLSIQGTALLVIAIFTCSFFFEGIEGWRISNFLLCVGLIAMEYCIKKTDHKEDDILYSLVERTKCT